MYIYIYLLPVQNYTEEVFNLFQHDYVNLQIGLTSEILLHCLVTPSVA